jgi:hypothetical protein
MEEGEGMPEVPRVVVVIVALVLAFIYPFAAGIENAIGLLIIGFALYEAWRVNRYTPLQIEGPFQLGSKLPVAANPD